LEESNSTAPYASDSDASDSGISSPSIGSGIVPSFFEVKLDTFDGPIDLLLHLVKNHELEIERISLAAVTEQYLACIEKMQEFDLDIAAEYLVVAATLLSIKAAVLLQDPLQFENELESTMPDPHRELLERLRSAQIYKDGAQVLGNRDLLGVHVFDRPPSLSDFEDPEEVYRPHDSMLLGQAFQKLLERVGKEGFLLKIEVDSVTVVERMVKVLDLLRESRGPVSFTKLIPDLTSRMSLVNSFIAILELCRRCAIRIIQDDNFKEIQIALGSIVIDDQQLTSEFDVNSAISSSGDGSGNESDENSENTKVAANLTVNG